MPLLPVFLEDVTINFKAVLFDLDGTLLDTLTDIAESMNAALAALGFPTHPIDDYRFFIGDGIDTLAKRTIPKNRQTDEIIKKSLTINKTEYANRWPRNTKLYPGIAELLLALQRRNIPMTILSNKPHEFTTLMVKKLLGDFDFEIVLGVSKSVAKKPDPSATVLIADRLDIAPEEFVYLGDTNTDMETALAAGMFPVGALWGFRSKEELIQAGAKATIESPAGLLEI